MCRLPRLIMRDKAGKKRDGKAAISLLLKQGVVAFVASVSVLLLFQGVSWNLSRGAEINHQRMLADHMRLSAATKFDQAMGLVAVANTPREVKTASQSARNTLADVIGDVHLSSETQKNLRQMDEELRRLVANPGTGLSATQRRKFQLTSAGVVAEMMAGNQVLIRNHVVEGDDTNQRMGWLLGLSVLAATLGTVFVFKPIAQRLGALYNDFQVAMARIETQRAELQTQNIKLREQTALAEDQKRDLEELSRLYRTSANQFQSLFAGLPVACFAVRPNGEVFEWNAACEKLFGIGEAEVLQQIMWEVVLRGEDAHTLRQQFNRAMAGRPSGEIETRLKLLDEREAWVLTQSIPMHDMLGQVTGVLTACVDLTERKEAELALKESQHLISRMMESSPQITYVMDLHSRNISYANQQLTRLLGVSAVEMEMRGTTVTELLHPEDEQMVLLHWEEMKLAEEGQVYEIEFRIQNVVGSYRWVRTREVVFSRGVNGQVQQIVGSAEDITQKRDDEERLRLLSVVAEKSISGIVIADPSLRVVYANPAYEQMTGYTNAMLKGIDPWNLLTGVVPDQDAFAPLDRSVVKRMPYQGELVFERKDGSQFWSDLVLTPVFDADKNLTHFVAIQDDITERRQYQDAINTARERLDFALSSSRSAVFDWDLKANLLFLSKDIHALRGTDGEDVQDGQGVWMQWVHPDDREALKRDVDAHLKGLTKVFRNEHRVQRGDGDYVWTMVSGEVIARDAAGRAVRFIGTFTDITERKAGELRLAQSEQRWNFALEGSGAGVWDFNIEDRTVFFSRQWKQMLGYAEDEIANDFSELQGRIHPEDQASWFGAFKEHLAGQTEIFSAVVRVQHKNGQFRWLHDKGKVVERDDTGKPSRMIGMVTDITDQKVAALRVAESEGRFRSAIEALREGFLLQESSGRIRMANPQAAEIFGLALEEMLETDETRFLVGAEDEYGQAFPASEWPTRVAMTTGRPVHAVQIHLQREDEDLWIEVNAAPIFRPGENVPYAAVAVFNDITDRRRQEDMLVDQMMELDRAKQELESANEQLKRLATTDGLTGLMNHRHFMELMEKCMEEEGVLSVALMDVDHFKQYNDTFGHLEGDEVLRQVARLLEAGVEGVGTVARYGGEEFIVLLPGLEAEAAVAQLDKIRASVADFGWHKRAVTISVGAATLGPQYLTRTEFVNDADKALYASKAGGRNRVTHAESLGPEKGSRAA